VPIWKHEFYTDGSSAWTRCHHASTSAEEKHLSRECHDAH
jgi:molybdopterin synthase catalytic subunit